MARLGHSSTRAALIYQHATRDRGKAIALALGDLVREVQARASGAFTASHQRYWDAARRARGDAAGTRALTEVLLGHRTLPAAALRDAMDRAVTSGALDPQAVLIDARRLAAGPVAPVIPIGTLARYDRPAPVLDGYDALLSGSTR